MEDARCWMWANQRGANGLTMNESSHILNNYAQAPHHNSYDASWEERAFAEDAAGPHGGCIWPPRSYSCNFCGRVFRSAQALGGHMNVHRRDRARLKQSINPQDTFNHHQPSQNLQHSSQSHKQASAALHAPSNQVCNLAYIPNPNPASFDTPAPPLLALKISSPSATKYFSIDQERSLKNMLLAEQNIQTSDLILEKEGSQSHKDLGERVPMHCGKPDISVNLNLFLFQTRARKRRNDESDEDDDENGDNNDTGSKRRKLASDASSTMSSSHIRSSVVDRHDVQQNLSRPAQNCQGSSNELDLELKL